MQSEGKGAAMRALCSIGCIPILAACLLQVGCSYPEDPAGSTETGGYFISVKEYDTGDPIEGAFVRLTVTNEIVGGLSMAGISDAEGEWRTGPTTGEPLELYVTAAGYECYWNPFMGDGGSLSFTAQLVPLAYIRLHVKKVSPEPAGDTLIVTYENNDCFNTYQRELSFAGAEVDEVEMISIRTTVRNQTPVNISWASESEYGEKEVSAGSRDTVAVEILY